MAQIRNVLNHLSVETAIHRRKCHRSKKHNVQPGEVLLSIRESDGLNSKNYCIQCAREILKIASEKMAQLNEHFE